MISSKQISTTAFQSTQRRSPLHRRALLTFALAAIVALPGVRTRPIPPSLSTIVTGDAALAENRHGLDFHPIRVEEKMHTAKLDIVSIHAGKGIHS